MTIAEYEATHRVRILRKDQSATMRFVKLFLWGFDRFWTTYRLPWQKVPTICYPKDVVRPMGHVSTLKHEQYHAEQFRPWWGPWFWIPMATIVPLPFLISGRWWLEREAYVISIKLGTFTINEASDALWFDYAWAIPRWWSRRWFKKRLGL